MGPWRDPRSRFIFTKALLDCKNMSTSFKSRSAPIILELGNEFYDPVKPASFPKSLPRFLNQEKAQFLGLQMDAQEWEHRFQKFHTFPENLPNPLALRYHGHQFHSYNPDLGDGRGFLFAQFKGLDDRIYDLGTKGSGQTPYSRSGDGRLTLKGALREALATEMLESLGVRTSKTFCFFETGENLIRNDEPSPTRSAVLTRMNLSHIRIGSFQRFAYLDQRENLLKLMNYSCRHYFPELLAAAPESSVELAQLFLTGVRLNLASLSAQYMISGFVHGVLNSDNMNITGESFDYGPYRFLPHYDPNFTAAYFDRTGLYSYGRQPGSIYWNVAQLASCLAWAFPESDFEPNLSGFSADFAIEMSQLFFKRLNLKPLGENENDELLSHFFLFLSKSQAPFEQTFFDFHSGLVSGRWKSSPSQSLYQGDDFENLKASLAKFQADDQEKINHVYFQNSKPSTLLIDEIESIWSDIDQKENWSTFEKKIDQIRSFRGLYQYYKLS
jgi:uncharacterized protein YdiU (UPF0061 family)